MVGLPALYAKLLPEIYTSPIPAETKANCSDCAMCATGTAVVAPADGVSRRFRPDTKCCTYQPKLPNYLVGGLLDDDNPDLAEGQRRVRTKLQARVGVTPQWLKPSAKFDLLYSNTRDFFGRTDALRCPYYEPQGGVCTIWHYREAVCTSFHCRYVAGADGLTMWTSLKQYLWLVEVTLSRYAMLQIDPELVYLAQDTAKRGAEALRIEDLEERAPPVSDYEAQWRGWAGREEEFYLRCYELVAALSSEEVKQLLGLDGRIYLGAFERAYDIATAPKLPATLALNSGLTVKHLPDGSVALACYSELDALAMPKEAYELLAEFRGDEPIATVRKRLRDEKNSDFADELILTLYQHRILVAR